MRRVQGAAGKGRSSQRADGYNIEPGRKNRIAWILHARARSFWRNNNKLLSKWLLTKIQYCIHTVIAGSSRVFTSIVKCTRLARLTHPVRGLVWRKEKIKKEVKRESKVRYEVHWFSKSLVYHSCKNTPSPVWGGFFLPPLSYFPLLRLITVASIFVNSALGKLGRTYTSRSKNRTRCVNPFYKKTENRNINLTIHITLNSRKLHILVIMAERLCFGLQRPLPHS